MAISVQVPKDLSGIKTKVALNLTKRQIICFSGAAVAGIPLYFLTKGLIGTWEKLWMFTNCGRSMLVPLSIIRSWRKESESHEI